LDICLEEIEDMDMELGMVLAMELVMVLVTEVVIDQVLEAQVLEDQVLEDHQAPQELHLLMLLPEEDNLYIGQAWHKQFKLYCFQIMNFQSLDFATI